MTDLRRALWRYEAGLIRRENLEARFSEALTDLIEQYRAGEPLWSRFARLGTPEFVMCVNFDDAIHASRTDLLAMQFEPCLLNLQSARDAWKRLQVAGSAAQKIADAEEAARLVEQAARTAELRSLFSIRVGEKLLRKARDLFTSGEYRQSRFIALMCIREADRLLFTSGGAVATQAMLSRIRCVRELGEQATVWAPHMMESKFISTALLSVETISEQGKLILAECLIDDIERLAAPVAAFFSEVERELGCLSDLQSETIAKVVARSGLANSSSWQTATERLLEGELLRIAAPAAKADPDSSAVQKPPPPEIARAAGTK